MAQLESLQKQLQEKEIDIEALKVEVDFVDQSQKEKVRNFFLFPLLKTPHSWLAFCDLELIVN